ncbi:MAG: dienelactone hydrolase family protein [Spirochaetales bacterium]|nr:dienelactone hydrolase family protein [Spirochaetales bacterium]
MKTHLFISAFLFLSIFFIRPLFSMGTSPSGPTPLPPDEANALKQLETSPRHGEWVTVKAGNGDMVDTWVVYPERKDKAPVVIVIHEIYGLTDWARSVADRFAAAGFIALAPDFLSGKGPGGKGSSSISSDQVRDLIRSLDPYEINNRLDAVAQYGTSLAAATGKFGVVGFCWGGGISFSYATHNSSTLGAAVVYYGTSPETSLLSNISAPVLGLYGGDDARVNATIPEAEKELMRLNKRFEKELYDGAGHAFLRQLDGREGANLKAAEQAWPRTIFFLMHTIGK